MKILSINDGFGSSIGVFENGIAKFCIEEERFNRTKNWMGFPQMSLNYIIANKLIEIKEIDFIVITNERILNLKKDAFYEYYDINFNNAFERITSKRSQIIENYKSKLRDTLVYDYYNLKKNKVSEQEDNVKKILQNLGFDSNKIIRLNHHLCHSSSAYYGLAQCLSDKYLIFTLDGGGDSETDTVSIGYNGILDKKSASSSFSIGNIYSCVTYFLGFKPHEHEYKLMGLAPYVNPKYSNYYADYFSKFLDLKNEDTEFYNPSKLNHSIFFQNLLTDLKKDRFDNIAAGLQKFTEQICIRWIKGNVKKYGINKVLCSGGVFMNVKLNKLISCLPGIEFIDVFPSCGDESNIFGAAYYIYNKNNPKKLGLLESYTLGTSAESDLKKALIKYKKDINAEVFENVNKEVAILLSKNMIVARSSGKMEFGARALGNRSILANPSQLQNVTKINQAVKKRDFWMPFAPALIFKKAQKYIEIPDSLKSHGSPYMMFAFDTHKNDELRQNIICGIHQSDFTARMEGVNKKLYPDFHEIIEEFEKISGIPCVLNTSFNLHGYPIVENSDQAINVFLNSKIDFLNIGNVIISRK